MEREDNRDTNKEYSAARNLAFAILWQCVKDLKSSSIYLRKDAQACIQSDHIKHLCDMIGIEYSTFLKLSLHYDGSKKCGESE